MSRVLLRDMGILIQLVWVRVSDPDRPSEARLPADRKTQKSRETWTPVEAPRFSAP
jgi:hypothetical protein